MSSTKTVELRSLSSIAAEAGATPNRVRKVAASLHVRPAMTVDQRPYFAPADAERIAGQIKQGGK